MVIIIKLCNGKKGILRMIVEGSNVTVQRKLSRFIEIECISKDKMKKTES